MWARPWHRCAEQLAAHIVRITKRTVCATSSLSAVEHSATDAAALSDSICPTAQHRHLHNHAPGRAISGSSAGLQQPQRKQQQQRVHSDPADVMQPHRGPWAAFQSSLQEGTLRRDPRQVAAMQLVQRLFIDLEQRHPHPRKGARGNLTLMDNVAPNEPPKRSWWSSITRTSQDSSDTSQEGSGHSDVPGLYLWGGVGCGKTMLMDLFVASAPKQFYVQRTHYHDFMLDVHTRLRNMSGEQDPLTRVADNIAMHTRVICLDELFVNDVADAMILARLFARLFDRGITLVATSNRRPDKLYENGLQRPQFVPFIHRVECLVASCHSQAELMQKECTVHDMDSVTDYRTLATRTVGSYFVQFKDGHTRDERLTSALDDILAGQAMAPVDVSVAMGRTLHATRAAGSVACFTFDELCGANVGASDYIAVNEQFHTIALKGVPIFTAANCNTAYRFVKFIDLAYEHRVKMLVSAEAYADQLFQNVLTVEQNAQRATAAGSEPVVDDNLGFAKDRVVSRLTEMQTLEYTVAHARMRDPSMAAALEQVADRQRSRRGR